MRIHLPVFSAFLLLASINGFSLPPCARRSNINRIELLANKDGSFASEKEVPRSRRAPPPEISFVDDDDESSSKQTTKSNAKVAPPAFSIEDDGASSPIKKTRSPRKPPTESDPHSAGKVPVKKASPRLRPTRPKRTAVSTKDMAGTSWMDKNKEFANQVGITAPVVEQSTTPKPPPRVRADGAPPPRLAADGYTRSFRQDFRATRVFVQGIPPGTSWQELKDHFKIAGEVVFASVSVDPQTGMSKGHGIVQYESTEMAEYAIQVMRSHPLNGGPLYVREDVQENSNPDAQLRDAPRGPTPPTKWTCANEDNIKYMSEDELKGIRTLIKARDDARRRRKYDVSDTLRDELKANHGVFIDDRLKMWWTAMDGNKVPQTIQDINGDGRWGKLTPWRQIPTTPENDACVNPELVDGLLKQRDVARKEKDFGTADRLLEDARVSPDGPLALRIHDESRTWRVWTEAPPPRPVEHNDFVSLDPEESRKDAAQQCRDIVMEHAPEKEEEIKLILDKFPGREFGVLKKLKKKYLS
jgi:hypothetical protein